MKLRFLVRALLFSGLGVCLIGAILYHIESSALNLEAALNLETSSQQVTSDRYTRDRYTPLMIAADQGDLEAAKQAIANGVNINARGLDGQTAILCAAWNDHREIVHLLLQADVQLSADDQAFLMLGAIRQGNIDLVRSLQQRGLDLHSPTPHYYPLRYAVWTNQSEIVKYLLAAGADPNRSDDDAHPILLSALLNESEQYKTSVITDYVGPISSERASVVILLIHAGADPNARSTMNSTTVLTAAAAKAPLEVVDLLIQKGANVNTPGAYNQTPLMFAAERNEPAIVKRLLAAGANPNAVQVGYYNKTALIYAVESRSAEAVKALLDAGASVNAVTIGSWVNEDGRSVSQKQTALDAAERLGYDELVNLLRQYGAKPYAASS